MELAVSQLWRGGPEWLKAETTPFVEHDTISMPEECSAELRGSGRPSHSLLVTERKSNIGALLNCQAFGSLRRLLRVTVQVLRAVQIFKSLTKQRHVSSGPVTPEELSAADELWVSDAQSKLVQDKDFKSLRNQFNLFVDEKGLWRCGGRLANAELPYTTKHPVLLPRSHPLTSLIVQEAHDRVKHDGVKETLTEIRRRSWIVRGRSLVRAIIHRCITCRRYEGAPFKAPPPPPLPTFRVKEDPAFTYTGVDFAGPLFVRAGGAIESNTMWIGLFSCFVTRAIHLDIVSDLNTETFIRCLKRFAARRGLPRQFISDNGKTFKAASKYIEAVIRDETVREYLADMGCKWLFNTERAPWWGGAFERMVKSTKRCLRKMVGRASFSYDEFLTAVVEIESVINSRPLSYVSACDVEEPLTPSHLLIGRRVLNLPDHLGCMYDPDDEDFVIDSSQLTRRMQHFNNTMNHFWRRWRTEYLQELRESHRQSMKKSPSHPQVAVGDVVIVHDDGLPRGLWKLGRIERIITGRDGQARGASVRVASRDRQSTHLHRPLQLLYPLEISVGASSIVVSGEPGGAASEDSPTAPSRDSRSSLDTPSTSRRPQGAAAVRASERRKVWIRELSEQ